MQASGEHSQLLSGWEKEEATQGHLGWEVNNKASREAGGRPSLQEAPPHYIRILVL